MNIVALDFLSLVHPFTYKLKELPPDAIPDFCGQWVRYFANPHLYCPNNNPIDFNIWGALPVLCVDAKNKRGQYWRHDYLPTYKTGRRPKSELLLQVRDLLLDEWIQLGLPCLREAGFEADDWAGALVKHTPPDTKIALVSVDSDWAQLVSDRVMWMDVYPPSGRKGESQKKSVLGVDQVLERFNNQTKHIKTRLLTHPYDLVDHKHEFGDWASDKIPAGRLVDVGIIDLLNPCIEPENCPGKVANAVSTIYTQVPPPKIKGHMHYGVPSWLNDEYSGGGE